MIIREFNNLEEIQKYYDEDTNTYIFKEDGELIDLVVFNIPLKVEANIKARCIDAYDITALDINACDINALNIIARDINGWNISAFNIKARNINYDAVCFAYGSIICNSIEGERENAKHFVLDGKIKMFENEKLNKKDLDRLKKYEIANKVFVSYLMMFNDMSFDTYITSQCTVKEQEICREIFKEVLESE